MITNDHYFSGHYEEIPFTFHIASTCLHVSYTLMRDSFPCLFIYALLDGNTDNWAIVRKVQERGGQEDA